MSFHPPHLRQLIRDTLHPVHMWNTDAEELLMGTAAQESHLGRFLFQINGPAIGIFQCEPANHDDIWINYLSFRPYLIDNFDFICGVSEPDLNALRGDLRYQILVARVHYLRIKEKLPSSTDVFAQSFYWDRHYNRNPEKGFPEEYRTNYFKYVRPQ